MVEKPSWKHAGRSPFGIIFESGEVDPLREFAELRSGGKAIMEARREKSLWQSF